MLFEKFSPVFEKVFRVVFVIWASFWLFINFSEILYQYSIFEEKYDANPNSIGAWMLDTISTVISFSLGVSLLGMMLAIPYKIARGQKIQFLPLMQILSVFYYLFLTLIRLGLDIVYSPDEKAAVKALIFGTAWIFPSIVMMIFNFIYFHNLSKYTEFIENMDSENSNLNTANLASSNNS